MEFYYLEKKLVKDSANANDILLEKFYFISPPTLGSLSLPQNSQT